MTGDDFARYVRSFADGLCVKTLKLDKDTYALRNGTRSGIRYDAAKNSLACQPIRNNCVVTGPSAEVPS